MEGAVRAPGEVRLVGGFLAAVSSFTLVLVFGFLWLYAVLWVLPLAGLLGGALALATRPRGRLFWAGWTFAYAWLLVAVVGPVMVA